MKVAYRSFTAGPQSPATELMAAYQSLAGEGRPVHLLGYTPVARMNPYQSLIYSAFSREGIAVAPVLKPDRFRDMLNFDRLPGTRSLHLHWNSWMTFGELDPDRARRLSLGMVGRLAHLREKGVNVIWTVHNVYPHDATHLELELEVQQRIADAANIIHVMSNSTVPAMDAYTAIDPAKVLVSPHPNYKGAYVDTVSRHEARAMLGLHPDEVVFLLFGAIKEYKGLERLKSAILMLAQKQPLFRFRVVVAGGADGSPVTTEFVRWAMSHPNVLIESSKVPNERAQYFLRAADVGLVNYDRSLNSGAALLYGTFDLPVIAADILTFREGLDPNSTVFVEDASAQAFGNAMLCSADLVGKEKVLSSLRQHIAALDPQLVSRKFARELVTRLS